MPSGSASKQSYRALLVAHASEPDDHTQALIGAFFDATVVTTMEEARCMLGGGRHWDAVIFDIADHRSIGDLVSIFQRDAELLPALIAIDRSGGGDRRAAPTPAITFLPPAGNDDARLLYRIALVVERQQLAYRDRQMVALIELNPDAVLVIASDHSICFVNAAALDLFGRPREQLLGEQFGFSISADRPADIEVIKGGSTLTVEMRIAAIVWSGEPATLITLRDVTTQRAVLARSHHAQKMEALGQLSAGIAHDFNNTLQAISSCLEMIDRTRTDGDLKRLVKLALNATKRGASTVQRLLLFSRKRSLKTERLATAEVVRNLVDVLLTMLGKAISIETKLQPSLPDLVVDRGQLETVLLNIAANASDAMPRGGALTVAASVVDLPNSASGAVDLAAGRYVRFLISDTGEGMSAAVRLRATEPFFTTKPVGKGTGLGLAEAAGFARQSGGALTIDSKPDCGTTVALWLPAASDLSDSANEGIPPSEATAKASPLGARLLLVDDDDLIRAAAAERLRAEGMHVVTAEHAAAGMALLDKGERFDVVLSDFSMPDQDGVSFLTEVRRRFPHVRTILLTGYLTDVAASADEAVIDLCLHKPITVDRLRAAIASLPGRGAEHGPAVPAAAPPTARPAEVQSPAPLGSRVDLSVKA